ncbi:hypothetical protein H6G97_19770 [Nostoc flagelliforme FACHB-838]|uniref:Excalibur calcium-binding domain-containing protein n=1 Tax=Nostoc flagelliforme FACHB-838 TaxID=2692904 RepID=A0ABR8DS30_9NOSO|nr:hypothetical protein [Nostoc flagelliforme FACHB-838]
MPWEFRRRISTQPKPVTIPQQQQHNCDSLYPDFCIPLSAPDLDCRFKVVGNDPHNFDGDSDGIGCER